MESDPRCFEYYFIFIGLQSYVSIFNQFKSIGEITGRINNGHFHSYFRKRSLSDCPHDDLDNTRDSVLSDQSQYFAEINNEPELMIIDFEYCAYNYRGFDLANHFIEWTFDYTNREYPFFYHKKEQYPTKEQQVRRFTNILLKIEFI